MFNRPGVTFTEAQKAQIYDLVGPSRAQLTTQRRNMLTMKADIEREIKKLQAQCATLEAGAQALEFQINQMIVDKPPE